MVQNLYIIEETRRDAQVVMLQWIMCTVTH